VKFPSIVLDDEKSIGHQFIRIRSNSNKLVKPRFKVHEKATDMLKDDPWTEIRFGRDQRREGYLPREDV
jgi:hypothetical protein